MVGAAGGRNDSLLRRTGSPQACQQTGGPFSVPGATLVDKSPDRPAGKKDKLCLLCNFSRSEP